MWYKCKLLLFLLLIGVEKEGEGKSFANKGIMCMGAERHRKKNSSVIGSSSREE